MAEKVSEETQKQRDFNSKLEMNRVEAIAQLDKVEAEGSYSPGVYRRALEVMERSMDKIDEYFRSYNARDPQGLQKQLDDSSHCFWFQEVARISKPSDKQDKLQVSLASTQKLLLEAWAEAEGKSLSGVAAEALAIGLAQLRKDGTIPKSAVSKYETQCEFRSAVTDFCKRLSDHWLF